MSSEIPEEIIIPPPSIKEIIHKTAQYVNRNGRGFEEKIKESESNNNKFNFINDTDPYNAYYEYILEHIDVITKKDESLKDSSTNRIPEPVELDFLTDLPPITLKDLEIIKLTALFVAKNGENYIVSVKNKYAEQSLQFKFLDSEHSFHKLFLNYLKQYRRLINEDIELTQPEELLKKAYERAQYQEQHKIDNEEEKKAEEAKKQRYASIDWQDFILVETIEFTEVDKISELPAPITIADLQFRSLEQKSKEVTAIEPPTNLSNSKNIRIREFGATRLKQQNFKKKKTIECPITGRMIPESQFERHIQILLRDPKYQEEKKNYEAKIKNSNLTTDQIVENIKSLFKPRTAEPNKRQKLQWDGYQSSVEFVKSNTQVTKEELEDLKRKQEEQNRIGPVNKADRS